MYTTLTVIFKNGARQIINLHSSFNETEKVRGRAITPAI